MKKATLTITFDADKLTAIRRYMGKKDATLDAELDDIMQKLYEKHVPPQVREYIEFDTADDTAVPEKLKRPAPKRAKKETADTIPENPTE